eukprot:gene5198-biopygen1663
MCVVVNVLSVAVSPGNGTKLNVAKNAHNEALSPSSGSISGVCSSSSSSSKPYSSPSTHLDLLLMDSCHEEGVRDRNRAGSKAADPARSGDRLFVILQKIQNLYGIPGISFSKKSRYKVVPDI